MKHPFRFKPVLFFCISLLLLLCACSKDTDSLDSSSSKDGKVSLAIHIAPVHPKAGGNTDYFNSEKIKSLRLILISTDNSTNLDTIEFNNYIAVENGGIHASEFQYDYLWRTKPGNKKFYLFANEESVSQITAEIGNGDSDSYTGSLSDLLNTFNTGDPVGNNIDDVMNSISFTPDFTNSGSDVFLPYSSVYDEVIVGERNLKEVSMFIVPAATKFIFNFTNYRPFDVWVSDISIYNTNTESYLFGQVNETDFKKEFEDQDFYWVDWLAKISQLSQDNVGFNDNINFNDRYGWISDYEIPSEHIDISVLIVAEDKFSIKGLPLTDSDSAVAETKTAGPFYVPESKNLQIIDNDGPEEDDNPKTPVQSYYLNLVFQDLDRPDQIPIEIDNEYIENLKALFRNTFVIINITLRQGDVEVYAQIADWNRNSIKGSVKEDSNPPSGLNFP